LGYLLNEALFEEDYGINAVNASMYITKIPFLRTGKGKYSHEKQKCLY
jgi:hypothetical protein